MISYDHSHNLHTEEGARTALPLLLEFRPISLLDVGCGTGTWMQAASEFGIPQVTGIDGVLPSGFLPAAETFVQHDLTTHWDLHRRFDVVLCLEVAEHLPTAAERTLISCLTTHSDLIIFSAACPGQTGQNHVNCQWPAHWQQLFNEKGFSCDALLREKIWSESRIEPWYRQNIIRARRNPGEGGKERRLRSVVHPEMLERRLFDIFDRDRADVLAAIENGSQPLWWYLCIPPRSMIAKLSRRLSRSSNGA